MTAKPSPIDEGLRDIVGWGDSLARHISGMTLESFRGDEKTQHAVSKCAEAIGEAAKAILREDPGFDSEHSDLRLKAAAKSRDRLSHGYRHIDLEILWNSASQSIPTTVAAAREILARRSRLPENP
jgi:uncharacterized protein with HEPN domain